MMSPHIDNITIITNKGVITVSFMTLANLIQSTCYTTLCLMIVDLYKMHFKEINIKNKVFNYYNNLAKLL